MTDNKNSEAILLFEELGLTRTEATIYLALLKKGSSTAYRISKEAQLYKANTYQAIEALIKKNLVVKEVVNNKQLLHAVQPEEFVNNLDRQKEKIQFLLPHIERAFQDESEGVSVFQGINAFMNLLYDLLKQKEHIYVFDIPNYVPQLVRIHIAKFHKERIKHKVKMYHIYDYNAEDRIKYLNKIKLTYAKQGKQNRFSLVSTLTCGNTTLIINWKKGLKVVKIIDKDIAETYKNQFDVLWKQK